MKTKDLINEVVDLPVDMRAEIADLILQTLNEPDPDVEQAWAEEAQRRLNELENGEVEPIPGEQVMDIKQKPGY